MAKGKKDITLEQAGERWLKHIANVEGMNEGTVDIYRRDLGLAEAYFGADRVIDNIMPAHVGAYQKSDLMLKKANGKPKAQPTIDRTVRVLRKMLVWAAETGLIEKNPVPKALLERKKREPKAIAHKVLSEGDGAAAVAVEE